MNIKKTMDLAAFFSTPTPPPAVLDPAGDVPGDAPVQPITKDKVSKPIKAKARPTKSKRVKEKEPKEPGVAARTTKTSKKSPAKPTSAKKAHSGNLADVDDDALDPDADADPDADMDRDFDEIPEDDSQWGGGEDIHENESEIGDDHACMDDEDLDDEAGMVTCDVDLDTSYSRIGAWKRRDKSTLPCPDLVGPPLEPDVDSHIL